jgi:maltose-binding protein MalE
MKKLSIHGLLLGLLIVLLSGCSLFGAGEQEAGLEATGSPTATQFLTATPAPTQTATPTPVLTRGTLTIWHSLGEEQIPALEQVLAEFSQLYPDVYFDVLYVPPDSLRSRYELAALENRAPDILLGPAEWGVPLYQAGLVGDLADIAGQDLLEQLNPAAIQAANYRGALVGLPYGLQGVVLYRNKALIPKAAETFGELVSLAQAATKGEIIGASLERGFFFSGGHLLGLGGQILTEEGLPAFNNETGSAWLELLKAFDTTGPAEFLSERDVELFKQGRVGYIIDGTWNMQSLAEALGRENLAIDPWPAFRDGSLAGFVQSDNLFLNSRLPQDERLAAQAFIEHFLSPESQALFADSGLIPALSAARAQNPAWADLVNPAGIALTGGVPYPTLPQISAYLAPMDVALKNFFSSEITPVEALNAAFLGVQSALASLQATSTPAP